MARQATATERGNCLTNGKIRSVALYWFSGLTRHNRPTKVSNLPVKPISLTVLLCAVVVSPSALGLQGADSRPPQNASDKSTTTTITALVKKTATFSGKRVTVLASFHSDGIHASVLMEPNCGRFDGTSKTPHPGQPQCFRGVVPWDTDNNENDAGTNELYRVMELGLRRTTEDRYITAEFTGIFRCDPSCRSPKQFVLDLERVEKFKVVMKDLRPHRPE
jgi:hypothetical protein